MGGDRRSLCLLPSALPTDAPSFEVAVIDLKIRISEMVVKGCHHASLASSSAKRQNQVPAASDGGWQKRRSFGMLQFSPGDNNGTKEYSTSMGEAVGPPLAATKDCSIRSNECRGSQDPKLEHVCGRPLGLRFNKKTGDLYIADAYLGLLMVGPNSTFATPVSTHVQHLPFRFTNSLDIDQDSGVIYFTDSSTRFQRREFMSAIITGDKTGRVMKYDPKSKETQVLLDGLSFPNGLVLSANSSFLLIAESTTCRILRYRLQDPKPASFEVLAQLPGFPDNIKHSPRGGFWVALHSRRGRFLQWILSLPWLGELLLRTPLDVQRLASFVSSWRGQALAVRLSEEGEVLEVLEGFGGRTMRFISEVEEHNGSLWIGSVIMPFVGLYKL